MKKKKICHIIFSFNTGGTENMLVDIMNEQVKYADVSLIIIKDVIDPIMENAIPSAVSIIKLNQPLKLNKYTTTLFVWGTLLTIRADIIHLHEQTALSFFPFKIPFMGKTVITTVHDTGIKTQNFKKADIVFSISKAVQDDIYKRYSIKSILNHNGINISSSQFKKTHSIQDPFKILQISRLLHSKKGQDILIEAVASLSKDFSLELHFIGEGESKDYLQKLAFKHGIKDIVAFHGNLPKQQVYKLLPEFDLLVQPSRYEGFGLTVAEAMIAKVPVLVSDIEGPMEVIKDGLYGFHFKTEDISSCKTEIINVINKYKSGEIETLVDKAYDFAKVNYNIERTARVYAEC